MAEVMIGIDPHKSSHTAVAIGSGEEPLSELQVAACPSQAGTLLAWAAAWPERTWAVEGAAGLGHLLAQQLVRLGRAGAHLQLAQLLFRQPDRHRGMRALVRVDPNHHFRHQHTPDRSHRTGKPRRACLITVLALAPLSNHAAARPGGLAPRSKARSPARPAGGSGASPPGHPNATADRSAPGCN